MAGSEQLDLETILTRQEREAIFAFLARLKTDYGGYIDRTILFGSKARGESRVESDIDLLVTIKEEDRVVRRDILRLGARVSLEYDVLLNILVMSAESWEAHRGFTLYNNIQREGLPVVS